MCRGLFFDFWRLIKFQLDVVTATLAIVAQRVVAAQNMLAFCRRCLLLPLENLTKKGLVAILALDLVLLFADGALVEEAIGLLLQRLDVVLVQELGPAELLDQLLVDSGFARCALRAELDVDEVEDSVL